MYVRGIQFDHLTPISIQPSLPSMDPSLQESILQTFTEMQQWMQQFIVEDSGKLVDLASATIQQAPRTNPHPVLIGYFIALIQ